MKRNTTSTRMNDYKMSVIKWSTLASRTGLNVLIIENSGNAENLQEALSGKILQNVSFFQCRRDTLSKTHGNSAGEFKMLAESISEIRNFSQVKYCWKVTGRVYIKNFTRIARGQLGAMTVNRFYKPAHLIDTKLFGCTTDVFCQIFSQHPNFSIENKRDKVKLEFNNTYDSMEDFVTLKALQIESSGLYAKSMEQIPRYSGISATINKPLSSVRTEILTIFANILRPLITKLLLGSTL
jgi:hypothetical protein